MFQICYGPEIPSVYELIRKNQGCSKRFLKEKFQFHPENDISSLLEEVLVFLRGLGFLKIEKNKLFVEKHKWENIRFFIQLREISENNNYESTSFIFAKCYERLFVESNRLYIQDVHREINTVFEGVNIGKEKSNAWKRIMEYFGLGYRVYSGFYALPHLRLMKEVLQYYGDWQGPIQIFFQKKLDPILPCFHHGQVFKGFIFCLSFLNNKGGIELINKQDLPYNSFGPEQQWNWIKYRSDRIGTMFE